MGIARTQGEPVEIQFLDGARRVHGVMRISGDRLLHAERVADGLTGDPAQKAIAMAPGVGFRMHLLFKPDLKITPAGLAEAPTVALRMNHLDDDDGDVGALVVPSAKAEEPPEENATMVMPEEGLGSGGGIAERVRALGDALDKLRTRLDIEAADAGDEEIALVLDSLSAVSKQLDAQDKALDKLKARVDQARPTPLDRWILVALVIGQLVTLALALFALRS